MQILAETILVKFCLICACFYADSQALILEYIYFIENEYVDLSTWLLRYEVPSTTLWKQHKKLQMFPNAGFSMYVYQALSVISRKQYEIPFLKLAIHDDIQDRYYKDTSHKAIWKKWQHIRCNTFFKRHTMSLDSIKHWVQLFVLVLIRFNLLSICLTCWITRFCWIHSICFLLLKWKKLFGELTCL